jgi:hypothetical protein
MILNLAEIVPGIVAFMIPETLLAFEASCLRPYSDRFVGIHPLVCISVGHRESVWAVLSSKHTRKRTLLLPTSCKLGHKSWTSRNSFVYGFNHVWRGPNIAFQEASCNERSRPLLRNFVTADFLPSIRGAVNSAFFGCSSAA